MGTWAQGCRLGSGFVAVFAAFGLALGLALTAPAPAQASDRDKVEGSFDSFAQAWMEKLWNAERANQRNPTIFSSKRGKLIRFQGYSPEFATELRATGSKSAPYVGLIRYRERTYTCPRQDTERCRVIQSTPVTEIFRFQAGKWIY